MAVQLLYCDPAASESGITGAVDHPYTRFDTAVAAAGNDTVIYVRRGRIYTNAGTASGVFYINAKSPTTKILVTPYGDEEMPPTAMGGLNMLPGDTGWTYVSDGVWKKALLYNSAGVTATFMRLFVGSSITGTAVNRSLGTGYSFGTAVAKCAVATNADEATILADMHYRTPYGYRIWHYTTDSTGYLYVWTGSATQDPPTYYDGITLVGSNGLIGGTGWGKKAGAIISNSSNVTIDGVDSIFCTGGNQLINGAAAPVSDCTLTNANCYAFGSNGLYIAGYSATRLATRFAARNCKNDAIATLAEEWNHRAKGSLFWINGSQDGAVIGSYTDSCTLERVETIDAEHGNTFVGSSDSTKAGYTINSRLIDCIGRNPNRLYGSMLGIAGLGAGNASYVDRFRGSDAVSFISRTGSGKAIISNSSFRDAKKPYADYDYTDGDGDGIGEGINSIPGISIYKGTAWGNVEAGCLTIDKCSFSNPYGFMLALLEFGTAGAIPAGSFVATDTLFVDRTYLNDSDARTFNPTTYPKPGVSWDMRDSSQAGAVSLTGCHHWTGSAGASLVATSNTVSVAFSAWAGLTGTPDEADPLTDSRGYLLAGSPLKYTGTFTDYNRDADGKPRPATPSRGAYEYVELRTSRT